MTNKRKLPLALMVILSLVTITAPNADDTEIYTNNTAGVGGEPLVMFTLDLRSSVMGSTVCNGTECDTLIGEGYLASAPTTQIELLKAVLKKVMAPLGNMKIGLLVSHDNNNNCAGPGDSGCSGGAYLLMGLKDITTSATDANKVALDTILNSIVGGGGSTSHSYQGREMYFEFFRYLTGQAVYSAHLGFKDYGNNSASGNLDTEKPALKRDMDPLVETDADSNYSTPGAYVTPIDQDCSKIFTINFMFGVTNGDDDADSAISETIANGGMDQLNISGNNKKLETLLSWLRATDLADGSYGSVPDKAGLQNVTSYFVVPHSGLSKGNDMAVAGGTTAAYELTVDDPDALVESLSDIFSQILSVSTTFTAASVPVSVLNRAQVVDNVYIALFKADANALKRWPGNVKKLRLDSDAGLLVDVNGVNAVALDGRIKNTALTYWTDANNLPAADLTNGEVTDKDGRAVQRGGAGQKTPGFISGTPGLVNGTGTRTLYYEPSAAGALPALNADASTAGTLQTALGAASAAEAEVLLQYARGLDVNDDDGDGFTTTEARSWIIGDPLHSRPLPINYGARTGYSDANPDIRLIMGSNDGFLHMFKNLTATSYAQSGEEVWAYMPQAVMSIVAELKANPAGSHPYGVDGAPAAYIHDDDGNGVIGNDADDKAWVFFGLRRGGRGYYALDVTNPDSPTKLWSITNATTGFAKLGYTFATPRVGYMNWGSGKKPVVIVAGGYHLNKDASATDDSYGNAIYIIDAETGALVWKAEDAASTGNVSATEYNHINMDDSIPSTVTAIDTTNDTLIDRVYVGDTGGRVWRVDVNGIDRTAWKISALASLGRQYNSAVADDRRFFHRPDFIQYQDSAGDFDAVVIASGNRSNPLGTVATEFLYVIKDRDISSGTVTAALLEHDDLNNGDVTSNCLQDGGCSGTDSSDLSKGWRLQFELSGEKSLATPTTLAKKIFVTTYIPPGSGSNGSCEPNEGTGRLYALSLIDGSAVKDYAVSNSDDIEKVDRYTDLDSGGIPAEVVYIPFNKILKPDLSIEEVATSGRWKTYWYKVEN